MNENKILQYIHNPKIVFVILFFAIFLPYSNIFPNEFVYDDSSYFMAWDGIKNIDIPAYFAGDQPINFPHVYRPIRSIMQGMVYTFTRSDTFGYHIFSILVHFINTLLIFFIAKKLTNKTTALATSIIFAVLPIHVMSVTFMTAVFNTAGVIYILLSFYFYILFREKKSKMYYYLSLAIGIMAFFSYEAALILPLIFIIYEICFQNMHPKNIITSMKYIVWYFFGGLIFLLIRRYILQSIYTKPFLDPIEFTARMLTMAKALMEYIHLTIINYPLSVYHQINLSKSLDFRVFLSLLVLIFLLYLSYILWKKGKKIYTFIILWFFIGLLPYSNIIQISSFVDEQYLYIASFSWALFLGNIFTVFLEKSKKKSYKYAHGVIAVLIMVSAAYGYGAWARNFEWKNNETLWTITLKQNPSYGRSYGQIASYYEEKKDYARAEEYLLKGISILPDLSSLRVTLGDVYAEKGDYENAMQQYVKAIELRPGYAPSYHNLGYVYLKKGNNKKAEEYFRKAMEISPVYYESIFNLAVLLLDQKKFAEAQLLFEKASMLRKKNHEIYFGLGMSYMGLSDKNSAKKYFERTLVLNPGFAPAKEMLEKLRKEE